MHRERVIFSRLYVQYTCIRRATLKHLNVVVLLYRVKNKIEFKLISSLGSILNFW